MTANHGKVQDKSANTMTLRKSRTDFAEHFEEHIKVKEIKNLTSSTKLKEEDLGE